MSNAPLPSLLLEQWHPVKNDGALASQFTAGSGFRAWWMCPQGHEWNAMIVNRVKNPGCPYCTNRRILSGYNDLSTRLPVLASQWHPSLNGDLFPQNIGSSYAHKVWWLCDRGHEWQATVVSRASNQTGCPVCSGNMTVAGINDLATTHSDLVTSWHPDNSLAPSQVRAGSQKKVLWRCLVDDSHVWQAMIKARVAGSGCPHCSGRLITPGVNDLITTFPDLSDQWHPTKNTGIDPKTLAPHSNTSVWWQCKHGHDWQARPNDRNRTVDGGNCPACVGFASREETRIGDWLQTLGIVVERRVKKYTYPFELDIYLPEYRFAIEFNGLYWHSEAAGKDRKYHASKRDACVESGITLFQVWEDDWRDRENLVRRMILHRLNLSQDPVVFARKTEVVQIDYAEACAFLNTNHVQGAVRGSVYLGLRETGPYRSLVAVMVLLRMPNHVVMLERYATSCRVTGGFTKLLRAAVEALTPRKVVTFADNTVSDGALYDKTGFVAAAHLAPDYAYLVRNERVHKFNYRLKRFRDDPSLIWEEGLTESQLAALNGLVRIWDAGKVRYELIVTN